MRRTLLVSREDGSIVEKELPKDAAIVTPNSIAAIVGDESGFPLRGETLVAIIMAAACRLGARNRYLEG